MVFGRPSVVAAFFFCLEDTQQSAVGSNGPEVEGLFVEDLEDGNSLPSTFSASVGLANRSAAEIDVADAPAVLQNCIT